MSIRPIRVEVTLYLGQNRYRKPRCRIGLLITALREPHKFRGVHRPKANDSFPPYLRFLPLLRIVQSLGNFFQLFPFLVMDCEFRIPLFPLKCYISPCVRKFIIPPYFLKFFPYVVKFTCFYILYMFFVSLWFDHDAFLHHTMLVAYWTPL